MFVKVFLFPLPTLHHRPSHGTAHMWGKALAFFFQNLNFYKFETKLKLPQKRDADGKLSYVVMLLLTITNLMTTVLFIFIFVMTPVRTRPRMETCGNLTMKINNIV